jgi:hypothetical protein
MHVRRQRATTEALGSTFTAELVPDRHAVAEAVTMIEQGLVTLAHRQLVTSEEVCDLLLDVRAVLNAGQAEVAGTTRPRAA